MCSCLQRDATPRYPRKCVPHRFRCRRQFLFQNDFACFIQNTVERPAISQIHTDRQLLLLENFALDFLHSANLFHSRSPSMPLKARYSLGAYPSPWRPAFSSHLINAEKWLATIHNFAQRPRRFLVSSHRASTSGPPKIQLSCTHKDGRPLFASAAFVPKFPEWSLR